MEILSRRLALYPFLLSEKLDIFPVCNRGSQSTVLNQVVRYSRITLDGTLDFKITKIMFFLAGISSCTILLFICIFALRIECQKKRRDSSNKMGV
jgi:hypothetical protein